MDSLIIEKIEYLLKTSEKLIEENTLNIEKASEKISLNIKKQLSNYNPLEIQEDLKEQIDLYIQKTYGPLPRRTIIESTDNKVVEISGQIHQQFETILKYVKLNIPVMMIGPSGSGKNHLAQQIADYLNLNFYYSSSITQEFQLTGFIDAQGNYQGTTFYDVCKNGGLFLIDEIDASVPETLIIINSALANGYFNFPNGVVKIHENARFLAAGNTFGNGVDRMYVGRNQLDISSVDRFAIVELDYDEVLERNLLNDNELFEFIREVRKALKETSMRYIVSMRASIYSKKAKSVMTAKNIVQQIILKNMSLSDMKILFAGMKNMKSNTYYLILQKLVKEE